LSAQAWFAHEQAEYRRAKWSGSALVELTLPAEVDPEVMSGVPVIAGTRVPLETLFDHLIKGSSWMSFWNAFRP
jgi:uncharacterized protein (DUF433 family)